MKGGWDEAVGFRRPLAAAARLAAACALIVAVMAAPAATESAKTKIQTCRDANGRPIITDPSDPRCYKPPLNDAERAAAEEDKRKQVENYNACKIEQRSQQSLLSRYPDKAKHDEARHVALSQVEASNRASEERLAQLQGGRKGLLDDAEFYPSGNLPAKLRRDLDTNSALIAAQTQVIAGQKEEAAQKNKFYDDELAKLKRLWQAKGADSRPCVAPRD